MRRGGDVFAFNERVILRNFARRDLESALVYRDNDRRTLLMWVAAPADIFYIPKSFTFVIPQPRLVARPGSLGSCERRGAAGGSRPKLFAWPWTTRRGTELAATTTRSTLISTSSSATARRRPLTGRTRSRTWNSRVSGKTFVTPLAGSEPSWIFPSYIRESFFFRSFNASRLREIFTYIDTCRVTKYIE